MGIATKKSLGQHFLLNPSTIEKIIEKAEVKKSDLVLEIGSGPGLMTERLAARARRVIAVEKDRRLVHELQRRLSGIKNLTLIEGDFLSLDLPKILPVETGKWKVVANLPYNISTEVIFLLLKSSYLFQTFHLMVQREVAERLVAGPGSRDYGLLSIFSQLFSENRIVMRLPPGAFTPSPKVHSALVEFRIAEGCRFSIHHLPTFETMVRAAFSQRRKMIHNSLKGELKQASDEALDQALKKAGVLPTVRAETVSIGQFVEMANFLKARGS